MNVLLVEIIKEHKHGCSIQTPKCPHCNQYFDTYGPRVGPHKIPLANGGFIFKKFFFACHRCHLKKGIISILEATPEEVAILNKFSQDGQSFQHQIIFPPSLGRGKENWVTTRTYADNPYGEIPP